MAFEKATKGKKPARIVIGGPTGSGKTYTLLTFAKYLPSITGKRTAAVDTEYRRMSLYADKFDFDVNNFDPPFDPEMLIVQIHEAEKDGYGQMIVDSSTHFYSMEGGLLEIVQTAAKKSYGGNQYAGWAVGTPIQNELVDTIIRSPMHMLFGTRAKQGYVEVEKANGRKTYEKVGMELIARDGWEFDFDFSLIMDMENNATVSKGMGYVSSGKYIKLPNEETMELILRSINENSTEESAIPPSKEELRKKIEEVKSLCSSLGGKENKEVMALVKKYGKPSELSNVSECEKFLNDLAEVKPETKNSETEEKE